MSTVQDLLDKEKFPEEQNWLVTIHLGYKSLVKGSWEPFKLSDSDDEPDQIQVLSSDDPFRIMSQMEEYYTKTQLYKVTLNCIELVKVDPYTGQSYWYRGDFETFNKNCDSDDWFLLLFYWALLGYDDRKKNY